MIRTEETICAPATARGGAISVIRISGKLSFDICEYIFFPTNVNLKLREMPGYRSMHGEIKSGREIIDEVILSKFRAPNSYTGEDSVEISCHASPYIVTSILELLISKGAVIAQPGEFTMRAFLNGKLDLSQAEAVADLIAAETKSAHILAINQMRGGFSNEIQKLRSELLGFISMIELGLDFGEEELEFIEKKELVSLVLKIREMADNLVSSFRLGNAIKNGIPVAIVGKPNSGKSTLLNSLLNEERAIVSEIPGTTRDSIEDSIVISGLEYRFIDTAGLRDTSDKVESLGIRKTKEKILQALIILLVDEITESPEMINRRVSDIRNMVTGLDKKIMVAINKIDQAKPHDVENMKQRVLLEPDDALLFISAKNHTGLERLRSRLGEIIEYDRLNREEVLVTNLRHFEALRHVSESLGRVISGFDKQIPDDLIATDIRQCIHYLGEITGEITSDEILGNIFSNFCIGK